MLRLDGRIAIVTGGGQGIGRAISLKLGQEGASVVIADINVDGSRETAERILGDCGGDGKSVPTNLLYEEQVVRLIQETLETYGRIDILVNNSGIAGPMKKIEDISGEEWDETLGVNLRGMFFCCKHVIPAMKKQKTGSIVNVSSVTGKRALIQRTPYAASKMGVIGFTRTLAAEVGSWSIRVNAVCPGGVTGPRLDLVHRGIMKHSGKSLEAVAAEMRERAPLKTFVDPGDVASVVAFLCSDDAAMMTGQDINVSAGSVMY